MPGEALGKSGVARRAQPRAACRARGAAAAGGRGRRPRQDARRRPAVRRRGAPARGDRAGHRKKPEAAWGGWADRLLTGLRVRGHHRHPCHRAPPQPRPGPRRAPQRRGQRVGRLRHLLHISRRRAPRSLHLSRSQRQRPGAAAPHPAPTAPLPRPASAFARPAAHAPRCRARGRAGATCW